MKYLLTLLMLLPFVACAEGDVPTYQNPVIKRSLPDPTVIKAHDGYFYLYAMPPMAGSLRPIWAW